MIASLLLAFVLDPAIVEIQAALSKIDGPKGYYTTTYSKEESKYWQNLPIWMQEDAGKRKAARVLDIGCGYGTLLGYAAKTYNAKGFCMDTTEYLWPLFRDPRGLTWAKGNIELDPIPWKEPFDVMVMTEVLEHFNFQPVPTLKKMFNALTPGGVLFLSTPDEKEWGRVSQYYKSLKDMPPIDSNMKVVDAHVWVYSRQELTDVLTAAGFKIVKFEYSPGAGHRHFNVMAVRP